MTCDSKSFLKGNFFTLDLMKARSAFEKLPWARNVSIRRRWPDKLEVVVEEHQELARWGSTALVNTHGELFYAATNSELPIFNGPADSVIEVASHYGEFSKTLNEANLKIAGLTLTPRRAWEVTTSSGMLIELGRVEMQNRIEKFANVYVSTIAGLNKKIVYADLRYPNGFAVRRPAADLKQMEEKIKEVNAIKKKPVAQVKPKPTEVSQQI